MREKSAGETCVFSAPGSLMDGAYKLAATVNNIYYGGGYAFDMTQGEHWYDTFVDYCVDRGILREGQFADLEAIAARGEVATIIAKALPDLPVINRVSFADIPDVDEQTPYADDILALYRSGIMVGDRGSHAFRAALFFPALQSR